MPGRPRRRILRKDLQKLLKSPAQEILDKAEVAMLIRAMELDDRRIRRKRVYEV